eukprot:4836872-Heterocapsa_arctica.AAC.1
MPARVRSRAAILGSLSALRDRKLRIPSRPVKQVVFDAPAKLGIGTRRLALAINHSVNHLLVLAL